MERGYKLCKSAYFCSAVCYLSEAGRKKEVSTHQGRPRKDIDKEAQGWGPLSLSWALRALKTTQKTIYSTDL